MKFKVSLVLVEDPENFDQTHTPEKYINGFRKMLIIELVERGYEIENGISMERVDD